MKGLGKKRQGSYDLARSARPVVSALSLTLTHGALPTTEYGATSPAAGTASPSAYSRQVTLQDILDLTPNKDSNQHLDTSDLDFESSRVIVVNTKVSNRSRGARKRSLSVSPRLGSRASGVGSSCGSVEDTGAARGGGFYTWMQSSLRRRLRKRAKKSTLPQSQTPPPCPHPTRDYQNVPSQHPQRGPERGDVVGQKQEVVTSSSSHEQVVAAAVPPASPPPSSASSGTTSGNSYCNCSPSSSGTPVPSSSPPPATCGGCSGGSSPACGQGTRRTQQHQRESVTYVNHRNGSVTAVSASSILQALTSASSGAKSKSGRPVAGSGGGGGGGGGRGSYGSRLSHSTRGRSTSVGRRVALSTTAGAVVALGAKKGSKKKTKRHRVFGGAWGLFHCAGAGARSRSCTPERNINYRVRSRSVTPERYVNVRVNPPPPAPVAASRTSRPGFMMKGKSKRKSKSDRRRCSQEYDDEANKENKYDMWSFIKERLEAGTPRRKGKPCAAERLSRRDTLPCRPRGSVNINRENQGASDSEFCPPSPPSPPEVPAVTRSASERRYDSPDDQRAALTRHVPPKDMCTYISRVPPTTDVNFNNYGSVLSMHLKKGETLPLNFRCSSSQTGSVASSLNSVGSKDSKDSGVSSHSGGSSGGAGGWTDAGSWRDRTNTLPSRYRNRPLPPIPKPQLPPKPQESGIHLVKTLKLDKFMRNKWISGVAVTRKNDLVVVDLKEAYLIDADGNLKRTLGAGGKGMLKEPIDVTVMSNGNVAFSDHADQEVKVFTTKGQFVRRVMDKCLANIAGVATADRRMYIAGTDKRCITVHSEEEGFLYSLPNKDTNTNTTPSASTCAASGYGTVSGSGKGLFEHPYSIAVNPLTGDIIVGDDYKQRVVALSPDGRVLWRYSPTGDRHFFPCSIAVDSEGYVFIADLYNEKVYMLDSSGKHLKVLLSRGEGLKGGPGAIAVDGRGHLVVADEERTLKVFKYGDKGFALYRRFSMCPDAK